MELYEQVDTLVTIAHGRLAESGARSKDARVVQLALSCIADIVAGRAELVSADPAVVRYRDGRLVLFDGGESATSPLRHPR
ncbi:MAG: hypothetical protein JWO37_2101 [Acidimicrobiales bacterium]|nr:hypothetical protein [Acidimicrobiales bacterium]